MNPHQLRRVRLTLDINVLPHQNVADVVSWVNKFFTYFHPNLEAMLTAKPVTMDGTVIEHVPSAEELLGEDPAIPDEIARLLGDEIPPGLDLLK